jgi:hypothetical protein
LNLQVLLFDFLCRQLHPVITYPSTFPAAIHHGTFLRAAAHHNLTNPPATSIPTLTASLHSPQQASPCLHSPSSTKTAMSFLKIQPSTISPFQFSQTVLTPSSPAQPDHFHLTIISTIHGLTIILYHQIKPTPHQNPSRVHPSPLCHFTSTKHQSQTPKHQT